MQTVADTHPGPGRHHVDLSEISIGVVIGRASEFFDFFVFSIACVLVFPAYVFPFVSPIEGTLYSFLVLALGFVARPIGTMIFTEIDRRHGRGPKLTIALFLLGTSTVAISFLPSYETAGWLTIFFLCIFRVGQGVAIGGAWDGLSSLLALNAPEGRKARVAVVPQIGAPVGLIMAAALFLYLETSLSEADFLDFGWRYPLFVVFAVNVVALFARLRLVVSDEFRTLFSEAELNPGPPLKTVSEEWRNIVIGSFTPLATSALFHMVTVFPLSWIALQYDTATPGYLLTLIIGGMVCIGTVILSGVIADQIGRRALLSLSAMGIAAFAILLPLILNLGAAGQALYALLGFALLGLSFGQSSGAVASGFALKNRYTASNLTADLAWMFGAGFAPFAALGLAETLGLWSSGAYLLSGALCTLAALNLFRQRQQTRRETDESWR